MAHDIGNMVAYAYAASYPDKVERLVVMDAPIPGIEPWSEILQNPGVWHFNFHGPDAERLVQGRERIYFDRIWNDFTADPEFYAEMCRIEGWSVRTLREDSPSAGDHGSNTVVAMRVCCNSRVCRNSKHDRIDPSLIRIALQNHRTNVGHS